MMDTEKTAPINTASPPPSPAGDTAVRYGHVLIQRPLGKGGMGEVSLGFHEGFQTPVVVKLLPERLDDSEFVDRFLREAQVAVRLEHANIVRVFDVGREHGRVYMVMEYVEGQDLEAYTRDRGGRLPTEEALRLVGEAARGLAWAHGEGVIHRDIKPANLIRRAKDGRVKIVDFGLARANGMDQLSSPDQAMGTLSYMPLEQIRGHAVAASDVYALGVSLYRLLSGKLPILGSFDEVIRYHTEGSPAPLSSFRPTPARVEALVGRMMARDPAARPDARAVSAEIDRLLESLGAPAVETEPHGAAAMDTSAAGRIAQDLQGTGPEATPSDPDSRPKADSMPPDKLAAGPHRARWILLAGAIVVACVIGWRLLPRGGRPVVVPPPPPGATGVLAGASILLQPESRGMTGDGIKKDLPGGGSEEFREGETIRAHEGLRVAIRTDAPLYVYLFNVDTEGKAVCLFPDWFEHLHAEDKGVAPGGPPRNPLVPEGGVILAPPRVTLAGGRRQAWWFEADASVGKEWFLLAADARPIAELEGLRGRADLAARAEDLRRFARQARARMRPAPSRDSVGLTLYGFPNERTMPPGVTTFRSDGALVWTVTLDHVK